VTGSAAKAKRSEPTGERFHPTFMHGRIIEAEHLARYVWAAQLAGGRRVLDAACGMAYGTRILAEAGASEVVGIDLNEEVVAEVRATAAPNMTFDVGDLRQLPYGEDEFDLITCFEAIEHVPDPDAVLDELRRVLRPGGVVALSTPNRDVYSPGNPFHLRELTPNELEAELTQRFRSVVLRRQHTWVASGIFGDESFEAGGNRRIDGAEVLKASENEVGKETYTLALASDGEIPADGPVVELSGDIDAREWSERLDVADHAIHVAPKDVDLRYEAEVELLQGELQALRRRLLEAEEEVRDHDEMSAKLIQADEALRDYVRSAEIINSASWKLTRPLRRITARIRQFRS
jgi:SAM-dependent methyltransferase